MSGVLDRMVKRARQALPTVEPRSAPRFAPQPYQLRNETLQESNLGESYTEVVSPYLQAESDRPDPQIAPSRAAQQSRAKGDEADALSPMKPFDFRAELTRGSQPATARPIDRNTQPALRAEAQADAEANEFVEGNYRSSESSRSRSERPSRQPQPKRASQTKAENLDPFKGSGTLDERAAFEPVKAEGSNFPLHSEKGEEGEPTSRSARPPRREQQQVSARSNVSDAHSSLLPQAAAEEKTEIHISIGSIELRAPRAEARPLPAAFRPRVTLDDFLRRRPEAQS